MAQSIRAEEPENEFHAMAPFVIARGTCALTGLALLLTACAGPRHPGAGARTTLDTSWLAGTWRGTATEVGAALTQGRAPLTIVFASDGTWKASNGASGTSRIEGNRVLLDGGYPGGTCVRYTLKGRERSGRGELWGMVMAPFGRAALSLERAP